MLLFRKNLAVFALFFQIMLNYAIMLFQKIGCFSLLNYAVFWKTASIMPTWESWFYTENNLFLSISLAYVRPLPFPPHPYTSLHLIYDD